MIKIYRGDAPPELQAVATAQLRLLRALGRPPNSSEITGYRLVADVLWEKQFYKCCYCERKITRSYHDVEHLRPKTSANRSPGCNQRHGYWWLAFDWENLLFACPSCNRSAKNDLFPTAFGTKTLQAEELPPGEEKPLLIDPAGGLNPVEHIKFTPMPNRSGLIEWWAVARDGSIMGNATIDVCQLNNIEQRELRGDHFDNFLRPLVKKLDSALDKKNSVQIEDCLERAHAMLKPRAPYVAFAFDVISFFIPDERLALQGLPGWPPASEIGIN